MNEQEITTLTIDDRTIAEKKGGVITIRQYDWFFEKEKVVILTVRDLDEISNM